LEFETFLKEREGYMGTFCPVCKKKTADSTTLYDEPGFDTKFCGTRRGFGGDYEDVFKDIVVKDRYRLVRCQGCGATKKREFVRRLN